jgi:phage baseplate assembly protein W
MIILMPQDELEEIKQNLRMIITTPKGSVPFDRRFGIDLLALDAPMTGLKASITRDIVEAVAEYEPRVEDVEIGFVPNNETGKVEISMKFKLRDKEGEYNV